MNNIITTEALKNPSYALDCLLAEVVSRYLPEIELGDFSIVQDELKIIFTFGDKITIVDFEPYITDTVISEFVVEGEDIVIKLTSGQEFKLNLVSYVKEHETVTTFRNTNNGFIYRNELGNDSQITFESIDSNLIIKLNGVTISTIPIIGADIDEYIKSLNSLSVVGNNLILSYTLGDNTNQTLSVTLPQGSGTVPEWVQNITIEQINNWDNSIQNGDNISNLINDAQYITINDIPPTEYQTLSYNSLTGLLTISDGNGVIITVPEHTHTIPQITGLQTALNQLALKSTLISAGVGLLGGGSLSEDRLLSFDVDWGDDRYLRRLELPEPQTLTYNSSTGLLSISEGNSVTIGSLSHTHPISDIVGLQDALDNKEDRFVKGNIIQGTNIILSGTLTNRLVGSGNITIAADIDLSEYYTKTELQSSGLSSVHWDNLTNKPTFSNLTSVGLEMPIGFSVSNSPITTAGNLIVGLSSGYIIPLEADIDKGILAHSWGDHSLMNYALKSELHLPVSIVTSNGLVLNATQGLSLNLVTTSLSGAMSAADKIKLDSLNNYTHPTQTAISVTTSAPEVISGVTVNTLGHTTNVTKKTLTLADLGYVPYSYTLPTATATILGGVKIGANITITDGVISVADPYVHPNLTALSVTGTGIEVFSTFTTNAQGHVTTFTKRTLPTATGSVNGILSSTDWTTFNNKQATLVSGTSIKSINGVSLLGSGDLTVGGISIRDSGGTQQWLTSDSNNQIRFAGAGDTNISFDASTRTITISSVPGTGSGTGVVSFNSRVGAVVSAIGDYNLNMLGDVTLTSLANLQILRYNSATTEWENITLNTSIVPEGTNQYFTQARARTSISLTTTGSSGAATYTSATGVFNIPNYTLAGLGGQPLNSILTSISGLSTSTTGLIKLTNGVASLDSSVYATQTWVTSQGYLVGTPAALTRTNDTNVTLTLGGTPATALLQGVSMTLGWTGTLGVARGGTGAATLTGVLIGNGTTAVTGVVGTANQLLRRNSGNTAYEFFTPTYLTSETDPIFSASPSAGITTTMISEWNTAFSWGNHSGLYAPLSHVGAGGGSHALVTTTVAGFMAAADKIKLDGLSNYVHPVGDGNLHVPATSTTNNGRFLKAGATAGSLSWALLTTADISNLAAYTGFDSRYYTETEINTFLSGKSDVGHVHANLTPGTGISGSVYNGGSAQTWSFNTIFGDARYALKSEIPALNSYIQNQYASAQPASAWISGNLAINGLLSFGSAGGYALGLSATNLILSNPETNGSIFIRPNGRVSSVNEFVVVGQGTGTIQARVSAWLHGIAAANEDVYARFGSNRTADGHAYIDLVGDTTYTSYGLRIRRYSGENGMSEIIHRGTGELSLVTSEAANIRFVIAGVRRMTFTPTNGNMILHTTGVDNGYKLQVNSGTTIGDALWINGKAALTSVAVGSLLKVGTGNVLEAAVSSDFSSLLSGSYVTTNTTQSSLSGNKSWTGSHFFAGNAYTFSTAGTGPKLEVTTSGGWARGFQITTETSTLSDVPGFGVLGNGTSITYYYMGFGFANTFGIRTYAAANPQVGNFVIWHAGNHIHRTDAENDSRYIQNQLSTAQGANAWISGSLRTGQSVHVGYQAVTADVALVIGSGRTGNGHSFLDLVGDTTYPTYGFRFIRGNTGANAVSQILHRGTGYLQINTIEAAGISFTTSSVGRGYIMANGNWLIQPTTTDNGYKLQIRTGSNTGNGFWIEGTIATTSIAVGSLVKIGTGGVMVAASPGGDYLVSSSLTDYATQTWVTSQGYINSGGLSAYATQTWVEAQGYLKTADLSGYVTTATNQTTGLSGNKIWTGTHQFLGTSTTIGATISTPTGYKLYVNSGSTTGLGIYINGRGFYTDGTTFKSDARFKTNIKPIENALDLLDIISGNSYEMHEKKRYGVLAQEIMKVLPHAVEEVDGVLGVDYNAIHALNIEAIKQLNKDKADKSEVEKLKERVKFLEDQLGYASTNN